MPDPDSLPDPSSDPSLRPLRPSGLPYPLHPPVARDDLPDKGPGAPASWGLRAGARIFDYLLVSLPAVVVASWLGVEVTEDGIEGPWWPRFIFPVAFMIYETLLIGRFGRTAGKLLFRVEAVDWERGGLAEYRQAAIRAIVPGIFLFLAVLGGAFGYLQYVAIVIYLSSLANVVYRGWHDRAAGTIVLSRPRPTRD